MNTKLLALALMVAGTTAACSPDEFNSRVKLIEDFGRPAEEPAPEPTREAANPIQEETETPVNTPTEYERWANDPDYVCVSRFREVSCLDDGRPVYLNANMEQLPFGVKP